MDITAYQSDVAQYADAVKSRLYSSEYVKNLPTANFKPFEKNAANFVDAEQALKAGTDVMTSAINTGFKWYDPTAGIRRRVLEAVAGTAAGQVVGGAVEKAGEAITDYIKNVMVFLLGALFIILGLYVLIVKGGK